jgi:hypothetical protein
MAVKSFKVQAPGFYQINYFFAGLSAIYTSDFPSAFYPFLGWL